MEALAEIGEFFWIGACLTAVFLVLSFLSSLKFGLLIKVAIPVFGFLIGICMGASAGLIFSEAMARVGAIVLGVMGGMIGISLSGQVEKR